MLQPVNCSHGCSSSSSLLHSYMAYLERMFSKESINFPFRKQLVENKTPQSLQKSEGNKFVNVHTQSYLVSAWAPSLADLRCGLPRGLRRPATLELYHQYIQATTVSRNRDCPSVLDAQTKCFAWVQANIARSMSFKRHGRHETETYWNVKRLGIRCWSVVEIESWCVLNP